MLSQEMSISIKGLPKSKPIDIIKKSDSFCLNIDETDKIDESINEDIYDHINHVNIHDEYLDDKYQYHYSNEINIHIKNDRKNDRKNDSINDNGHKKLDGINTDNNFNIYRLDAICFDPTKSSPPDEWSMRLKHRIRNYETCDSTLYIDYLFDNK